MILEPRKIKSDIVSTVSPSISHEVVGPDAIYIYIYIFLYIFYIDVLEYAKIFESV